MLNSDKEVILDVWKNATGCLDTLGVLFDTGSGATLETKSITWDAPAGGEMAMSANQSFYIDATLGGNTAVRIGTFSSAIGATSTDWPKYVCETPTFSEPVTEGDYFQVTNWTISIND